MINGFIRQVKKDIKSLKSYASGKFVYHLDAKRKIEFNKSEYVSSIQFSLLLKYPISLVK